MESEGDEDFTVSNPTKKVKKSSGEEKGKKKKGSSTKGDRASTSPKRKTPVKKSAKEETKKEKGKGKAKGKGKKDEDDESFMITEEVEDDIENFNPNESIQDPDDEEFETKSKTKSEKKTTKSKKEKGGGGGANNSDQETILEYLKKQNRPYSLINIFDNLHGKIKKSNCQKALDALTDEGLLQAKEFGKATVYLLNQQTIPQVSGEELDKLKEEEKKIKQEHTKISEELKEMNSYLKNLTNQPSNEQLEADIVKLKEALAENSKKLELYESGDFPQISDEDMKITEDNRKKFETEYKKRRRMCLDMLNFIAEQMESKLPNVIEMVGIEEE